jgi:organic hydroperoxide reductase OsmC/OhrA
MATRPHTYAVDLAWTGNRGEGTRSYRGYGRDHVLSAPGKPDIAGSADAAFLGDPARWNPEDLLLGALAACHQLWYLHLCADAGVAVVAYTDAATGRMEEAADGSGRFTEVVLRPRVRLAPGADAAKALTLHAKAARMCFIAASVAFPVRHEPVVEAAEPT